MLQIAIAFVVGAGGTMAIIGGIGWAVYQWIKSYGIRRDGRWDADLGLASSASRLCALRRREVWNRSCCLARVLGVMTLQPSRMSGRR